MPIENFLKKKVLILIENWLNISVQICYFLKSVKRSIAIVRYSYENIVFRILYGLFSSYVTLRIGFDQFFFLWRVRVWKKENFSILT